MLQCRAAVAAAPVRHARTPGDPRRQAHSMVTAKACFLLFVSRLGFALQVMSCFVCDSDVVLASSLCVQ